MQIGRYQLLLIRGLQKPYSLQLPSTMHPICVCAYMDSYTYCVGVFLVSVLVVVCADSVDAPDIRRLTGWYQIAKIDLSEAFA